MRIELDSSIEQAISKQLIGFLDLERPRNIEKLIIEAIDKKQKWITDLIWDLSRRMGSRQIAAALNVSRNRVRRVLKNNSL